MLNIKNSKMKDKTEREKILDGKLYLEIIQIARSQVREESIYESIGSK